MTRLGASKKLKLVRVSNMRGYIHHIEWSVRNLDEIRDYLIRSYGFTKFARRIDPEIRQEAVRCGACVFLLSEKSSVNKTVSNSSNEYPVYKTETQHDTVFNVCMEVDSVEETTEMAAEIGAVILEKPKKIEDEFGEVVVSSVRSCLGNVIHSIVNTKSYTGAFLPGFQDVIEAYQEKTWKGEKI